MNQTPIIPSGCRTLFAALLAGTILLSLAKPGQGQDRVYPKRDAVASGKFVEITPTAVKITVRNKEQTFDMADVRKLSFDDEPNTLDRVRESVLQGQYEQALDEVKKISADGIENPLIKQDIEFYRYYCEGKLGLAGRGDKLLAIKGLLAVAKENQKSHHLYDLSDMLGQLAMAVNQPDQALRYFNVLMSATSPDTKALGVYRLGSVELAQGKVDEAKVRFGQLAAATSASPEMGRLKSLAEVGLATCEQMSGNNEQALQKLDSLVQQYDSTDQELFARINNAKGAAYTALGKTNQALLSYLQTDLLFFTDAEAHAEALYHLAKLWPLTGQPARGAEAKARLTAQYASSIWANKD
ncbi:MAG: hypothetical protein IT422_12800 [Pirellulaceae bacterium]|jgi:Flp pilus assembly protein TadD|nr:hypothetical protein [Pirellulaceae bacterium]